MECLLCEAVLQPVLIQVFLRYLPLSSKTWYRLQCLAFIYKRCGIIAIPFPVPRSSILSYTRVVNPYIGSWDARAYPALVWILTTTPGDLLVKHLECFLTSLSIFMQVLFLSIDTVL